jgi:hypothetical protein
MAPTLTPARRARAVRFLARPDLWPAWPYLPVVRRRRRGGDEELGVLFDFRGTSGRTGLSAAVFLTNLFLAPADERRLLDLPHEVYDAPEEVADAGWDVD